VYSGKLDWRDYMLKKLCDNIYYMPHYNETDRPTISLIHGDKHSLVIDSGNSPKHAQEFLAEAKKLDIPPIKYLVITHSHWDHIFGIKEMPFLTIGNSSCGEKLDDMTKLKWLDKDLDEHVDSGLLTPFGVDCIKKEITDREGFRTSALDITFNTSLDLDLGGVSCHIKSLGGTHTSCSSIVYVPERKVLFLGDCIYGRRFDGVYGYDMNTLSSMILNLNEYDVDIYVPSHDKPYTPSDLNNYWQDIRNSYKVCLEGLSLDNTIKRYESMFRKEADDTIKMYLDSFLSLNNKNLQNIWNIS
jgi:glyoxylase-like metal-dependent hydrolase (beta-lactamase superfamily II)